MNSNTNPFHVVTLIAAILASLAFISAGCSTIPKEKNRETFLAESDAALDYFKENVPGLELQIRESAGYAIFPGVGQWGIIFLGGEFGRGTVNTSDGGQVGWAAVNTASLGLQLGAQGMKMLVIFEDDDTFEEFRENKLSGSASATAVAVDAGAAGQAQFVNGVAIYIGGQAGLMAGVNVALDYMRYKPMSQGGEITKED